MGLFDIFKRTAKEWFQEAQKVQFDAGKALGQAALRDAGRLSQGYINSYNEGEHVLMSANVEKRVSQCLDRALQIDSAYALALIAKGERMLYSKNKNVEEAICYFDKALVTEPNLASAYYLKATVLESKSVFDEALACYQRAVELDADDAEALMGKARILRRNGKDKDADECLAKAKILDPSSDQAIRISKFRWLTIRAR